MLKTSPSQDSKLPHILLLCVVLMIIFINSYSLIKHKNNLLLDEVYTFYTSNRNLEEINPNRIYTDLSHGRLIETAFNILQNISEGVCTQDSFLYDCSMPIGKDLNFFDVYFFQSMDVHPPLYYFVIHIVCYITHSSDLIGIGYWVNIFFLLITCLFVYKITYLVSNEYILALTCVMFYGLSYEFCNVTAFFRMYAMLSCLLSCLMYLYIKYALSGYAEKKYLFLIGIIQLFSMLTHYYALFFIVPLFLFTIKKITSGILRQYIMMNIILGVIFFVIWPSSILQIFYTRKLHQIGNNIISIQSLMQIKSFMGLFARSFFCNNKLLLISFVIIVLSGILCKKNERIKFLTNKNLLLCCCPSLVYFFIVSFFSPYISSRYLSPIMPMLAVIITFSLYKAFHNILGKKIVSKYLVLSIVLLLSIYSLKYNTSVESISTNYQNKDDFTKEYGRYKAVIYDGVLCCLFIDIVYNYYHPQYVKINEHNINSLLPSVLCDDNYIVYANETSDIEPLNKIFHDCNYKYEKIDYTINNYQIYFFSKVD